MADKQDVGVKVSKPGFNALTAPDYDLIFSSSWPQLPIVATFTSGVITPTLSGSTYVYPAVTFTHNLGYTPFCAVWVKGQIPNIATTSGIKRDYAPTRLSMDKTTVTYGTFSSTTNYGSIQIHIKVYGLDIKKPVSYPYKQPPVIQQAYDPNYGVKLAKPNKQITSNDMRDFIIHSRCQSPQVDSVNVGGTSVDYTNTSGYTNWVYGFGTYGGTAMNVAYTNYSQAPPILRINTDASGNPKPNYYLLSGETNGTSSIVVLRDPLFVAQEVQVTY